MSCHPTDFADTSQYLSAQNFTDNVINVAMPSTYHFLEKVIDEIVQMYQDAGVELTAFHVGGDEVPTDIGKYPQNQSKDILPLSAALYLCIFEICERKTYQNYS